MLGREAYENPWLLAGIDHSLFHADETAVSREQILRRLLPYIERELAEGTPLGHITRHILGLYRNQPGGRAFRRVLSQLAFQRGAGIGVIEAALREVESHPLKAVA
jgi:tRNA-dihydrouridine synthase A